jgi:hypothetical protein
LYRCWSYWQSSFPKQQRRAVLLYPYGHVIGLYANATATFLSNMTASAQALAQAATTTTTTSNFLQGFVQALILQLNVTLRAAPPATTVTTFQQPPHPDAARIKHTPNFLDGYALLSPLLGEWNTRTTTNRGE